mmetsp:Transcript_63375/g.205739  ORF Transcript_63375/g.205739 Transcript_63375/m.205739 type:complete len:155 (+) Transcript_63375:3102-3566(+)
MGAIQVVKLRLDCLTHPRSGAAMPFPKKELKEHPSDPARSEDSAEHSNPIEEQLETAGQAKALSPESEGRPEAPQARKVHRSSSRKLYNAPLARKKHWKANRSPLEEKRPPAGPSATRQMLHLCLEGLPMAGPGATRHTAGHETNPSTSKTRRA